MKNFISSLLLLVALVTVNAQTSIPVTNGDFSSGSTITTTGPWTSISGYTLTQSSPASLSLDGSSGVINGALVLAGTNGSNNAGFTVKTDALDISAGTNTATLVFSFDMLAVTGHSSNYPYSVFVFLYDQNGVDVTTATTASTSSVFAAFKNTSSQNIFRNSTYTVNLKANTSGTGLDAKTVKLQINVGSMLANIVKIDNIALTYTNPLATVLSKLAGAKLTTSNDAINVEGLSSGEIVAVYDTMGKKVKSVVCEGTNISIPLTKGVYIVKIKTLSQKVVL